MDLVSANEGWPAMFETLYDAKTHYLLLDLSVESWANLARIMIKEHFIFDRYIKTSYSGAPAKLCNTACRIVCVSCNVISVIKQTELCGTVTAEQDEYWKCVESGGPQL